MSKQLQCICKTLYIFKPKQSSSKNICFIRCGCFFCKTLVNFSTHCPKVHQHEANQTVLCPATCRQLCPNNACSTFVVVFFLARASSESRAELARIISFSLKNIQQQTAYKRMLNFAAIHTNRNRFWRDESTNISLLIVRALLPLALRRLRLIISIITIELYIESRRGTVVISIICYDSHCLRAFLFSLSDRACVCFESKTTNHMRRMQ